jgi:hypothetical protein
VYADSRSLTGNQKPCLRTHLEYRMGFMCEWLANGIIVTNPALMDSSNKLREGFGHR